MSKVETIKSALKFLVQIQTEQGSHGFSDAADNEISWNEVIGWIEQQPCEDCISRQAAIELFEKECGGECACCKYGAPKGEPCLLLHKLPAVSLNKESYDRGYDDGVKAYAAMIEIEKEEKEEDAEDCISRQEAIRAIQDEYYDHAVGIDIVDIIAHMPPVIPKAKAGRWEWVQYDANPEIGNFHCSECRYIPASFNMSAQKLNFCPNCGARMEVET